MAAPTRVMLALLLWGCGSEVTDPRLDPASDGGLDASVASGGVELRLAAPVADAVVPGHFVVALETAGLARVTVRVGDVAQTLQAAARMAVPLVAGEGPIDLVVEGQPLDSQAENLRITRRLYVGRTIALYPPATPGEVTLRLDRTALGALLDPEEQARVPLVDLDLQVLVEDALAALLDPVAFGVDTSAWGPAEHNLVRLLANTPASTDSEGSALGPVLELGRRLGLPAGRIFSDLLGISPDDPILRPAEVADALLATLVASHPAQVGAADPRRLRITLGDALADLAPLAERYGPAGDHPGVLAAPPTAELFTPAFAMVVRGQGRADRRAGLSADGHYATHLVLPDDGPVLDLDFSDPQRFLVEGLAPIPRAALTLRLPEHPEFIPLGPPAPFPRGASEAWRVPPWTLEHLVIEAAWRAYGTRFPGERVFSYALGALDPATRIHWQDGLVVVSTVADLGPPPPPAFVWDLILDVAQVRLHDGVAEGEAETRLALPPLAIGLDAEGLVAAMRPPLAAHEAELVEMMLGDPALLGNDAVAWVEGDDLVFSSDFEVLRDGQPVDRVALASPVRLETATAILALEPGAPPVVRWAPREAP